ncbi:MAG: hypothetical protein Q8L88_15975 [Bacteroidota bacterium]|nr:hypothetical protein [Bacteroidota bacterium]
MKVHIVCHGDISTWILGKFARKLDEHLTPQGVTVSLGQEIEHTADINHHIVHYDLLEPSPSIQTQMVTHIDSIQKFNVLKQQLSIAAVGICLSNQTVETLSSGGIPRSSLCYVLPAHDSVLSPRRRRVGITTRVYDDGRKREFLLGKLADYLDPKNFEFIVMGAGWEPQIEHLEKKHFIVKYFTDFDYDEYIRLLPTLDYFMYFGEDEGQMGFIDALAAGVETIVVPQGYHLDVTGGITYPFHSFEDLLKVFTEISDTFKQRSDKVINWTWANYARKHREIWEHLLAKQNGQPAEHLQGSDKDGVHSIASANDFARKTTPKQKLNYFLHLYAGYLKHEIRRHWKKYSSFLRSK